MPTNRVDHHVVIANSDEWTDGPGRVVIIDDHYVLAQGLAAALEAYGFEVTHTDADPPHELPALLGRVRPHVVLLDLWLGVAVGSGLGLIGMIHGCGAQIVILTASDDPILLGACVESGAYDLASKTEPFDSILAKVRGAQDGTGGISRAHRDVLLQRLREARLAEAERLAPFERLTPREAHVLTGLIAGQSANELADAIPVSLATVRTQIRGILSKLGVGSQLAAVALARRAGWPDQGGLENHQ